MNLERLYAILRETTSEYRKGEEVVKTSVNGIERVDVYAMPHESEAAVDLIKVDCHFITVGVDKQKAEEHRSELIELLNDWPAGLTPLSQGPSYIHVGGVLGDQGAAFLLFALGSVLGFWTVITPELLGMDGEDAHEMAGLGMIMIDGYRPVPV